MWEVKLGNGEKKKLEEIKDTDMYIFARWLKVNLSLNNIENWIVITFLEYLTYMSVSPRASGGSFMADHLEIHTKLSLMLPDKKITKMVYYYDNRINHYVFSILNSKMICAWEGL